MLQTLIMSHISPIFPLPLNQIKAAGFIVMRYRITWIRAENVVRMMEQARLTADMRHRWLMN